MPGKRRYHTTPKQAFVKKGTPKKRSPSAKQELLFQKQKAHQSIRKDQAKHSEKNHLDSSVSSALLIGLHQNLVDAEAASFDKMANDSALENQHTDTPHSPSQNGESQTIDFHAHSSQEGALRRLIFFLMTVFVCMANATGAEAAVLAKALGDKKPADADTPDPEAETLAAELSDGSLGMIKPVEVEVPATPTAGSYGSMFHHSNPTVSAKGTRTRKIPKPPKLPPGCENFKILKGNPMDPKTTHLLIGDAHGHCTEQNVACATGFAKAKGGTVTALLEPGHDKYFSCSDANQMDLSKIANDCRTWNNPHYEVAFSTTLKNLALETLDKAIRPAVTKIFSQQITEQQALKLIREVFTQHNAIYAKNLRRHKEKHQKLYAEFRKSHPNVSYDQFRSTEGVAANLSEILLKHTTEVLKILKEPDDIPAALSSIGPELVKGQLDRERTRNPEIGFRQPNRYLLKSILAVKDRPTVTIAGDAHVNPERSDIEEIRQIAQTLHEDLDKAIGKDGFAIISCPAVIEARKSNTP